jgi:pimeloyl-ACP methyl ester carboxylesterase
MTGHTAAPLVMLPGLICDELIWSGQAAALTAYRPVAINGYGNARDLASMARQVLDAVPGKMSLAGHSMGARVALEVFRLAPTRVERLALLDTGVHPLAAGEKEKRLAMFDIGKRNGMAALVDAWLPPMVHPDRRNDPAVMAPLKQMCLDADLDQFENQMTALIERPDARPLLASIDCPTLIGVGSDDEWAPVERHREIAAAIPGATLEIFEHAGHMSPFETPAQVTDSLQRWLDRPVAG